MSCSGKNLESFFIPLEEIHLATQNFSAETKIGGGGFGMVYKGRLSDRWQNRTAAIKRLDPKGYQGESEYLNELEMVSRFHHQNIVSFIGYCNEGDEKILVFEYAVNGSLDTHIENPNKLRCLTWGQRLKICLGTARGLEYLHSGLGEHCKVIHRDMKSANILLDENMEAKICDFGLSRSGPMNNPNSKFYTKVAGTQFYTDPSYQESGILSKESDVYSFGIVMFELMTGMLAHHKRRIGGEEPKHPMMHLVRRYCHDGFNKIIDPHSRHAIDDRQFFHTFKEIAYACINYNSTLRPPMDIIITKIEESLRMADVSYDGSVHGQSMQVVPRMISNRSLETVLLHGNLDIWVKEAKSLPNMDMFHNKLGQVFGRMASIGGGKTEDGNPVKVTSDPYVTVSIANAVIARTFVISNSENPVWMQHFYVPVAHYSAEVQFVVKDNDVVGSQIIGAVGVPVEQLVSGSVVEGTFPVLNESGKPCKPGAVLTLSIQYVPMERVARDPNFNGVLDTYFPLRRGGKVTLYQDAHVDDGYLPSMNLEGGLEYQNGDCWHDICEAIKQARRLIYITGWSVVHSVQLVRNGDGAKDSMLGDLLKAKSEEGVRVLLLVWDDPTSRSILGIKTQGVMGTSDEETRRFFKHSSVKVSLCPRSAGKGHSWAKKQETETIYTHHQKTVIVDADAGNYRRRIMAFVGGLDLCVGRYDTPSHPLFSTLQTLHKDDYHQPNYTGSTTGLPREPWHDLHSRIEGPAAYDVLKNFEERWLRASKPRGIQKMKKTVDDSLLKLERIPDILGIDEAHCTSEQDPEGWHVQVFRSIDSNSVKGFPKDPKQATSKNLVCGKNVLIDMSIHTAYVKAIRAAQHFIYIENQYFLGSSFNWSHHKTLGANNLVPMEIALKIANKIRANERFAAYIVLPMWPEGNPTSAATQRILFWQNKTMQMMYEVIYKALVEVGLENVYEPQDYLMFFCLGNRESSHGVEPTSPEKGSNGANTPQSLTRKSRRFMIYVHSKGMIVDDEFVIMGSANINQRSLEGSRDTEIAMGAYQPYHTWANRRYSPHGQIFGYRMSLWAEHIGGLEATFERPESIECVRRVRALSELNWKQYAAVEVTDMKAHLLKYPVEVDSVGQVKPLPGCPTFPDMGGNIVGSFVAIQENLTI